MITNREHKSLEMLSDYFATKHNTSETNQKSIQYWKNHFSKFSSFQIEEEMLVKYPDILYCLEDLEIQELYVKNVFSYYYTDFQGYGSLTKNKQYDLQSFAKVINANSPENYQIPSGEDILSMDFNLPREISEAYGGIGKIMFEDAHKAFDKKFDLDGIYGEWIKSDIYEDYGGVSINLKRFQAAVRGGLSREDAAFETVTGQWAKSQGYTEVKFFGDNSINSESIEVIFTR